MMNLKCSVCEAEIEVKDSTKIGERFTCPNCFAQLALKIVNGEKVVRCAMCIHGKETMECAEDCERKIAYEETKGFPFPE